MLVFGCVWLNPQKSYSSAHWLSGLTTAPVDAAAPPGPRYVHLAFTAVALCVRFSRRTSSCKKICLVVDDEIE